MILKCGCGCDTVKVDVPPVGVGRVWLRCTACGQVSELVVTPPQLRLTHCEASQESALLGGSQMMTDRGDVLLERTK